MTEKHVMCVRVCACAGACRMSGRMVWVCACKRVWVRVYVWLRVRAEHYLHVKASLLATFLYSSFIK